jgi:hypothetical protein
MILLFLPGAWMTYLYFDLRKRPAASQQPAYTAPSAYANFIFHGLDSDNRPINLGVSLISVERDTLELNRVIRPDSMYLIFRYSEFSCGSCVSETCTKLIRMQDSLRCVNVVLMPYYESVRKMIVQNVHSFRNRFAIYLNTENSIGLPLDRQNVPYLTFVDDGRISKHTFIVDSSYPDMIDRYLHMISKKYCKK